MQNDGCIIDPGTGSKYCPQNHHDGGFAGGKALLKDNEEFAKLLKGEYVATSHDISRFMRQTLPNIVNNTEIRDGVGALNLVVNVAGNLDKTTLPDLKNAVLEIVNKAMKSRGMKRDSFSYSV